MGDFDEDKHPRDGGKFTSVGGGAHVANTEKATGGKVQAHQESASKHRSAAKARRSAAEKERDPARRSEHLARANHHDERAAHHEARAEKHEAKGGKGSAGKKEKDEHPLAEWVAKRLEGAKEGVEKTGDKLKEAQERALEAKAEK